MNTFCRSWYFDLHVGGLTLAASVFSIAFFCSVFGWASHFWAGFFLIHTTGSRKNKVCLLSVLSMFMVTSWRNTTTSWKRGIEEGEGCCHYTADWGYTVCACSTILSVLAVLFFSLCSLLLMGASFKQTCHFCLKFFLFFSTIGLPSSWCIPLCWCCCAEFIFQPVNVLFFSCCSVFRVITLYPSPWLLFALLISSLCCSHSVSSLLSLSLLCLCVYCVGVH